MGLGLRILSDLKDRSRGIFAQSDWAGRLAWLGRQDLSRQALTRRRSPVQIWAGPSLTWPSSPAASILWRKSFQDLILCFRGVSLVLRGQRVGRLRRRSSRLFGQVNCLNFLPGNFLRSLSQTKAEMTSSLRFSVLKNGKACSRKHSCSRLLRSSHSAARFRSSPPFMI